MKHNIIKERLKDDLSTISELTKQIDKDEKLLIVDIGGYFAYWIPAIAKERYLNQRFIGIVEDTENGHQKYENYISESTIPVFSVARCQQKRTEDYNVGKSIVNTADMLLKNIQVRSEELICGVIGFGKIGSSIADHLRQKRVKKLLIYDQDPVVLMRAASLDFRIASKKDILKKCNMIYCATGRKSLSLRDLEEVNCKKVYIASCTSSDDEFECNVKSFAKRVINEKQINAVNVSVYNTQNGSEISFLAHGNAINFYLQNNALGNYIRGVQAAILVSALKLINRESVNTQVINEINYTEEKVISRVWLKYFNGTNYQLPDNFLIQSNEKQKFIRESDIQAVERILEEKGYCCIYGDDGTGKTEICRKFAQKNQYYYELIWYIDEANEGTTYKEIARKINVTLAGKDKEELLTEIFSKLIHEKNFLIIFDNIKDSEQINDIISIFNAIFIKNQSSVDSIKDNQFKSNLIFITKSKPSTIGEANLETRLHELKPLEVNDLLAMLSSSYPEWSQEANNLFELSARGNPFLLDKILSYLKHTAISLEEYKKNISRKRDQKSGSESLVSDQFRDAIFELTLDSIKEWKEKGKMLSYELILFSALLDGECLQPQVLHYFLNIEFNIEDQSILKYAINLLVRYGLLEMWKIHDKRSNNPYFMRKLTQNILRRLELSDNNFLIHFFKALHTLTNFFHYIPYQKHMDLEKSQVYISHVYSVIKHLITHPNKRQFYKFFKKPELLNVVNILYQLAAINLYEYRDYDASLIYFSEIDELINVWLDVNNDKKTEEEIKRYSMLAINGKSINNSHIWKKEGVQRKKDFEALLHTLQDLKLDELDQEKPLEDSLIQVDALINQSYINKYLGRHHLEHKDFPKGMDYLDRSLNILKRVKDFLENHKSISESEAIRKSLALVHHALGSLYLVLDKYANLYAYAKFTRGNDLLEQDNDFLQQAEENLNKAIELRKQLLESSHPDLARSLYKYSETLWRQYKVDKQQNIIDNKTKLLKALDYCKQAIAAQEKSLSAGHINFHYSKELKRKIKNNLKKDVSIAKGFLVNPWTPAREKTVFNSPRPRKVIPMRTMPQITQPVETEKLASDHQEKVDTNDQSADNKQEVLKDLTLP